MFLIHSHGPPNASEFIEYIYHLGSLNHRKFPRVHPNAGYTRRITIPLNRIIDALKGLFGPKWRSRFLPFSRCPRGHGSQFGLLAEWVGGVPGVYPYTVGAGGPETGQIRRVSRHLGRLAPRRPLFRNALCF